MADDTPSRTLRAKKAVQYNEEIDDKDDPIVQAETEAYGRSCGPMLKPPSYDDDSASDVSEEEEEEEEDDEDDDDDDGEYDDESEYEEDEYGNPVKVPRKKKKKTAAEIAAEKQVALHLGLTHPKEFNRTRSDIGYMYRAVCRNGSMAGIRAAYDALIFDNQCTPEEVDACIRYAALISRDIVVPRQEIANAFAPLSNFNGGYYTRTSGDVGILFGIAIMAQMVHVLPQYRQQGSAQQQGFAALLANAGMHGDVLDILAQQYTTDTPLNSAEAEAKELVRQLNELDGGARLQVLYSNLAGFAQRARTLQPPGYAAPTNTYDRSKFDSTRQNGAPFIAARNGAAMVALTLLHRTDVPGPDGLPVDADVCTAKLSKVYGKQAAPVEANYKPFGGLRDSYELEGKPGGYVETHRAHVNVPALVKPNKLIKALRQMLYEQPLEPGEDEQAVAPELKEYLDAAYYGEDFHQFAYLGVRFNGLPLSIGKEKPRCRSVSTQCYLHKAQLGDHKNEPQRWIYLGGPRVPRDSELANLLCPPWKGYSVGTVDFYLLLTDKRPQDVLDLTQAIEMPLKISANDAAREAAREAEDAWRIAAMPGKNPTGRKKRRLDDEESSELYQVRKRAYDDVWTARVNPETLKAHHESTSLHIDYPLEVGVWPADHPDMADIVGPGVKRRTEQLRKKELRRAKIFKRAGENHASVVAAEPGGRGHQAAASSFATHAAEQAADMEDLRQQL